MPILGLRGEVIQHYLQLEIGPVEVPYICNDCGYQIHKCGKAWIQRSKVHDNPMHERLEHTCSGSFRDLAVKDMVKHPTFLKPREQGPQNDLGLHLHMESQATCLSPISATSGTCPSEKEGIKTEPGDDESVRTTSWKQSK